MNLNDLQNIWNGGDNSPTPTQQEKLTKQFVDTLRRQRRNHLIWLVWTFFILTVMTCFVGAVVFGTNKVNLTTEWGLVALLLIPWTVAVLFLKRFLKPAAPVNRGDVAMTEALAAAAAANQAAQSRLKTVGVMYAIFIPVLAFGMWQLHAVGKTSSRELLSMMIFFGAALGISAVGVFARYHYRLVPQQKHLESLLKQF